MRIDEETSTCWKNEETINVQEERARVSLSVSSNIILQFMSHICLKIYSSISFFFYQHIHQPP